MNPVLKSFRAHPVSWVLGFGILAIVLFIANNLAKKPNDPRLMAIRQAGYPVTLAELNRFYSPVSEDQNAALVYHQVFQTALFTNKSFDDLMQDAEIKRGEALPPEFREKMRAVISTDDATWQLLYSATNCSGSRYPIDLNEGHMSLLPHLAKLKRAVTLLSIEGVSHASAGDSEGAYAALYAGMHAGDSLREEPLLISYLVRVACSAVVAKRLEQALNLAPLREEELRALQEKFAAADDPRWAARALAGERALGLGIFIDRRIQRSLGQPQQGSVVLSGVLGQLAISAYRATGLMSRDQNYYLDTMKSNVMRASMAAEVRVQSGPGPSVVATNRLLIFSRLLLPALARVLDRADENSARMRVVETALAVERFRVAHLGALPDKLEQLAPQYLQAVPLDPYDSQPLRYKKLPSGYVVYSIGADRNDDGGAEPLAADKNGKKPKASARDVTFIVERK